MVSSYFPLSCSALRTLPVVWCHFRRLQRTWRWGVVSCERQWPIKGRKLWSLFVWAQVGWNQVCKEQIKACTLLLHSKSELFCKPEMSPWRSMELLSFYKCCKWGFYLSLTQKKKKKKSVAATFIHIRTAFHYSGIKYAGYSCTGMVLCANKL